MTWIRMECDAADDDAFDQLGEALGISTGEAFYHYFALVGKLAKQETGGRLADLLDRTLEQWAKWRGTPGGFAGVFRGMFTDPATGELKGFRRRNEKLLFRQDRDRQKRKNLPGPEPQSANPPKTPGGFSEKPPPNPRANVDVYGNGTTPLQSVGAAPVGNPLQPEGRGLATLVNRLQGTRDRWAVHLLLDRVPDSVRESWAWQLNGYLDGQDFPAGMVPTPTQLATACRDYKHPEPNPAHFRAFVLRLMKPERPSDGPNGPRRGRDYNITGQGALDAAQRWADKMQAQVRAKEGTSA